MTEKIFGRFSLWLAIFALCFTITPGNAASNDARDAAASGSSRFDFYVLSLSWSPSYCAAAGEKANPSSAGILLPAWPPSETNRAAAAKLLRR